MRDAAGEGWSSRGSKLNLLLLWKVAETPREMLETQYLNCPGGCPHWHAYLIYLNSRLPRGTV